jgi:TolB protein
VCVLALTLLSLGRAERQTTTVLAAANGRIVFDSDRTGNRDIFAMDSDGSHVVNLTNSPTDEERAGNSPDGQKIAFARTVNDNTDIYVMNANGSGVTRLTTDPAVDHAPQWSPNGQKIAFRSDRDGNSNIYVMDADGSDQTRLTNNPADDNGPDWSPDGQKIVFSSERTGNSDVFVMDADGSNPVQLTTDPADDFGASWSPDGTRIAFRSGRNGTSEVYVMGVNGQGQTNLTNHPSFDRGPAWSPDGSKIAFYSNRDGNYEIYVMDANGSNVERLTNSPGRDFQPDWGAGAGVPPPMCYPLTRSHSGQGSDPGASPNKSAGCGTGQYVEGELIALTAAPAVGWSVAGWSGTNNDGSTAPTNTVTMPAANHAVGVVYDPTPPTCYSLTRRHTGQGGDPVATPNKSAECGPGQYVEGELIALTAAPDAGWYVAGWSGTNNDAGTAATNTVTMPAANHTVTVAYDQSLPPCFTLTRSHTGQGSDPVASPNKSTGCSAGQYIGGENITLIATPAVGWYVAGWDGTNNDAGLATTNSVTMPAADHTVSVTYNQAPPTCYTLARSHTGQGSDPTASPDRSADCDMGRYVAGEVLSLTATPAVGWRVAGWSGTNDDAATTMTNTVTMPTTDHEVQVTYEAVPYLLYAPVAFAGVETITGQPVGRLPR